MRQSQNHIVCIGGGAASFFFASHASSLYPNCQFTILEQGKSVLQKVKISGGGRCNVTHACFDPEQLIQNYPRGGRELLGPFYGFGPHQTIEWFQDKGVLLKTEEDGRMFPKSNSSQTIIDCLKRECSRNSVTVKTSSKVTNIVPLKQGEDGFEVHLLNKEILRADKLFIGAGSSKPIWQTLVHLGVNIIPAVPSLFTVQIQDHRIRELPGVSVPHAEVLLNNSTFATSGPLLITHKGLSGPAILKLSAFGARHFHEQDYKGKITVNFLPELSLKRIKQLRDQEGKQLINNYKLFNLPKRLFNSLLKYSGVDGRLKYASASNQDLEKIYNAICKVEFTILGQNRFKDEFVTAGGVDLKEIHFSNFSVKKYPNMHIAGECLNIDAVTGGFNFQNAWTGAYMAAEGLYE